MTDSVRDVKQMDNAHVVEDNQLAPTSIVMPAFRVQGVGMYKVGDRVTRQMEIGKPPRKTGTITEILRSKLSSTSGNFPLYTVLWDGVEVAEKGHFEQYLERP